MTVRFEENRLLPQKWGWLIIIGLALSVLGWGYFNYFTVHDAPRQWNYGGLPDTPAESVYSTVPTPSPTTVPLQLPPLPQSQPATSSEAGR